MGERKDYAYGKSKYLKAEELVGKTTRVVISRVEDLEFDDRGVKPVYVTDLASRAENAVLQFRHPNTGEMLCELRVGGGGKGAQTVFPGSTHDETGEAVTWDEDGAPAAVDGRGAVPKSQRACRLLPDRAAIGPPRAPVMSRHRRSVAS